MKGLEEEEFEKIVNFFYKKYLNKLIVIFLLINIILLIAELIIKLAIKLIKYIKRKQLYYYKNISKHTRKSLSD